MKTAWFLLILLSVFFWINAVRAEECLPLDWTHTLNVGNLEIDREKLEGFCTEDTCTIGLDFVTIRSHFNVNVALIIKDSEITSRLPYRLGSLGLIISSINPDEYDWETGVKIDLEFLKRNGILKIENSEIEKISALAEKGKNIFYCEDEWKALLARCRCEGAEEVCVSCEGALPLEAPTPKELMPYDLLVYEPSSGDQATEEPEGTVPPGETNPPEQSTEKLPGTEESSISYLVAILFLAVVIWIIIKYKKRKKNEQPNL